MPASYRHWIEVRRWAKTATDEELLKAYDKAARQGRVSRVTRAQEAADELLRRGWTPSQLLQRR